MESDGTWNGRSVICTPCYVRLLPYTPDGMGLAEDLPRAILEYRDAHRKMEERIESFIAANKEYTVTQEKLPDGGMKMLLINAEGKEEGGAILPPGRPIQWL
jgi:hypothetical protein